MLFLSNSFQNPENLLPHPKQTLFSSRDLKMDNINAFREIIPENECDDETAKRLLASNGGNVEHAVMNFYNISSPGNQPSVEPQPTVDDSPQEDVYPLVDGTPAQRLQAACDETWNHFSSMWTHWEKVGRAELISLVSSELNDFCQLDVVDGETVGYLYDRTLATSISSVTEGIALHDPKGNIPLAFSGQNWISQRYAGKAGTVRFEPADVPLARSRGRILFPWTIENRRDDRFSHHLLVDVNFEDGDDRTASLRIWDSLEISSYPPRLAETIQDQVEQFLPQQDKPLSWNEPELRRAPKQPNGWACGWHVILTAWALAMGLTPTQDWSIEANDVLTFYQGALGIMRLAQVGHIDYSTVLAFFLYWEFVETPSDESMQQILDHHWFDTSCEFYKAEDLHTHYESIREKSSPKTGTSNPGNDANHGPDASNTLQQFQEIMNQMTQALEGLQEPQKKTNIDSLTEEVIERVISGIQERCHKSPKPQQPTLDTNAITDQIIQRIEATFQSDSFADKLAQRVIDGVQKQCHKTPQNQQQPTIEVDGLAELVKGKIDTESMANNIVDRVNQHVQSIRPTTPVIQPPQLDTAAIGEQIADAVTQHIQNVRPATPVVQVPQLDTAAIGQQIADAVTQHIQNVRPATPVVQAPQLDTTAIGKQIADVVTQHIQNVRPTTPVVQAPQLDSAMIGQQVAAAVTQHLQSSRPTPPRVSPQPQSNTAAVSQQVTAADTQKLGKRKRNDKPDGSQSGSKRPKPTAATPAPQADQTTTRRGRVTKKPQKYSG